MANRNEAKNNVNINAIAGHEHENGNSVTVVPIHRESENAQVITEHDTTVTCDNNKDLTVNISRPVYTQVRMSYLQI